MNTKPKEKQLLPLEAFDAMTDALRPLVHGVRSLRRDGQDLSMCHIDDSPNGVTRSGAHLLDDLTTSARNGAENLWDLQAGRSHKYLPKWCEEQLYDTANVVGRAAWMLLGMCDVSIGDAGHPAPTEIELAAHMICWMVEPAYKDLCEKCDEYETAEKMAIEKQYEDEGWIKQPNGEWHPTPEMLKEREASS